MNLWTIPGPWEDVQPLYLYLGLLCRNKNTSNVYSSLFVFYLLKFLNIKVYHYARHFRYLSRYTTDSSPLILNENHSTTSLQRNSSTLDSLLLCYYPSGLDTPDPLLLLFLPPVVYMYSTYLDWRKTTSSLVYTNHSPLPYPSRPRRVRYQSQSNLKWVSLVSLYMSISNFC